MAELVPRERLAKQWEDTLLMTLMGQPGLDDQGVYDLLSTWVVDTVESLTEKGLLAVTVVSEA